MSMPECTRSVDAFKNRYQLPNLQESGLEYDRQIMPQRGMNCLWMPSWKAMR